MKIGAIIEPLPKIDRREFLSISAVAAFGSLLPHTITQPLLAATPNETSDLSLRTTGDATSGYGVGILFRGRPIAHNGGAEFAAIFQNGDRSLEDRLNNWKATSWAGNAMHVMLSGECKLKSLNTTIFVQVNYEVVTPKVVRKSIRLRQSDMFMLFYQVSHQSEAAEPPDKLWSFDCVDCEGGALHEYFPSAGFRTKEGVAVGLLTDAGYRNQWSRLIRRDGKPVKPAPNKIPDVNLYRVSTRAEGANGRFFVEQTFGQMLEQVADASGNQTIHLPPITAWSRKGALQLESRGNVIHLSTDKPEDGAIIPFSANAGDIYSVQFEYRSRAAVAAQIWDVDEQLHKLEDATLFNDRMPESPDTWSNFRTTIFVPTLRGKQAALFLSMPELTEAAAGNLELRGLEVSRVATRYRPYHRLEMDQSVEKTAFIFVDDRVADTLRGNRLASQLHLADALRFKGGETEKVLYADLMMLCWNAGTETFRPMLAPSIWYSAAGEMYLRDSFFALNGIHNRELNESVFNLWGENQGEDGAINTLVEPNVANLERKSNDSSPLWLIWALLNKRRFDSPLPMKKIRKAAEYCLDIYDPKRDGNCVAQFVMGQLDVITYPKGTTTICQNQGLLAILLRAIKELQIPDVSPLISNEHIASAEESYRSYYDPALKFVLPGRDMKDAIGFAEIFPEYLSLLLFGRKILTDEMMINHLDRIPAVLPRTDAPFPEMGGSVRPIFIGLTGSEKSWGYFTEKWHPMIGDSYAASYANRAMDGIYYNGGSWMRIEVCGYVAGKLHGWSKADKAIANRLWAEINVDPDFPTSQEYLPTDPLHPFYGYHRVFAWNSSVLQALELAGMRTPEMDPDYVEAQAFAECHF